MSVGWLLLGFRKVFLIKENFDSPMMNISQISKDLILEFEGMNSAGRWPGGNSGVTIGYGYDLGYVSEEEFLHDWAGRIAPLFLHKLKQACGLRGEAARKIAYTMRPIAINKHAAREVFEDKSLPKYIRMTEAAFPGIEKLHMDVRGALVSLVYNRGTSFEGPTRTEMCDIYRLVQDKDLQGIADSLRKMKRLWPSGMKGLLVRREKEALLVENAIGKRVDPRDG